MLKVHHKEKKAEKGRRWDVQDFAKLWIYFQHEKMCINEVTWSEVEQWRE